jgi:hypothetical protein
VQHRDRPHRAATSGAPVPRPRAAPEAAAPPRRRCASTAPVSPGTRRPRGRPQPGGGRPASRVLSCEVVCPGEWVIGVPRPGAPPGPPGLRAMAEALAGYDATRPAGLPGPAVVRVPAAELGPGTSAVLHYSGGRAVVYCPETEVTADGAASLAALASRAAIFAPPLLGAAMQSVTVTPVSHSWIPALLHPALLAARPGCIGFYVCSRLITPALGAVLGEAWTAHARLIAGTAPAAGMSGR